MGWLRRAGVVLLLTITAPCAWSKQHKPGNNSPPIPAQRIALDSLGMEGTPTTGLLATRPHIATLDFIDVDHVLLTYIIRPLLTRKDEEDPVPAPESAARVREDRVIHAEVVDLHDGKVGEQRDWRLYDRDWYLLPLGQGQFLLRRGSRLSILDQHLQARTFAESQQAIVYGQTSGGVLVAEFEHETHTPEQHAQMVHDATLFNAPPPVEQALVYGWKLPLEQSAQDSLFRILLPSAQRLTANQQGFVGTDGHDDKFTLFLEPYAAPKTVRKQLYKIHSDCRLHTRFLREDVLLITSCKGGQPWSTAINLDGKLLWQHRAEAGVWPDYSTSQDSRRFAVESLGTSAQPLDAAPGEEDLQRGLVQVFDVDTGESVFSTVLEPLYATQRSAALSPDGMKLAVLRKGALEIYNLPPVKKITAPENPTPKKK